MTIILRNGDNIELITPERAQELQWKNCENRWDWKSYSCVVEIAEQLTASTGKLHIGVDKGSNVSPQFDVIEAPAVGDEVSYTFNGDYYPCGTIVSISKTLKKITTSEGDTFYRRRNTGTWLKNRTWALIPGHRSELNPSF